MVSPDFLKLWTERLLLAKASEREKVTEFSALKDCAAQSERSLDMPDKYHALRGVLIAALLPAAFGGKTDSGRPTLTEQWLNEVSQS